MAEFARGLEGGQADLAAAAAILGEIADDDFRRHCSVAGVGGGVITIHVNDPGLVAGFRLQWAEKVITVIQAARQFASVRRATFEYGNAGAKPGI